MSDLKREIIEAIHMVIKDSRAIPKEGSFYEMLLLIAIFFWSPIKDLFPNRMGNQGRSRKSRQKEKEYFKRLRYITSYDIFSEKNLEAFDLEIIRIRDKYPSQIISAVKEMQESTEKYLEYPNKGQLIESYLPTLGLGLITLVFIGAYGREFILSKQGSLILALAVSLWTSKIKFGLAYDVACAELTKPLLERIETILTIQSVAP
jgi:hypothetical protein